MPRAATAADVAKSIRNDCASKRVIRKDDRASRKPPVGNHATPFVVRGTSSTLHVQSMT